MVTGDSGFCVTEGMTALHARGVYGQFLIKKRRYWPTLVPGTAMDTWFQEKNVGDVDAIQRINNGTPYFIWGVK